MQLTAGEENTVKILKEILSWSIHIAFAVLCGLFITVFIIQPTKVREVPWNLHCMIMIAS